MRVAVSEKWLEIEDAISALDLFAESAMPQLSHGMCPECHDTMMSALDDADLSASGQVIVGALP